MHFSAGFCKLKTLWVEQEFAIEVKNLSCFANILAEHHNNSINIANIHHFKGIVESVFH